MAQRKYMMETATCRWCGKTLCGTPYYMGGGATDPDIGGRVPVNYYGGYVCSRNCDIEACLSVNAAPDKKTRLQSGEIERVASNWA